MFQDIQKGEIMNRVKELRIAAKMTQADLAKQLDITTPSITKWEQGRSNPEISNAFKLADIFGVTLDYLLGRSTSA